MMLRSVLRRLPLLPVRQFSTHKQDDFFTDKEQLIAKVTNGVQDAEFDYTGRIADRQTEDDYTTENLTEVLRPLDLLVRLEVCRQVRCLR